MSAKRQLTEVELAAASRAQLRMLEASYRRSQSGRKWLRQPEPAPVPELLSPEPRPYFGPLFAEAGQ